MELSSNLIYITGTVIASVASSFAVTKWRQDHADERRKEDKAEFEKHTKEVWAAVDLIRQRWHDHVEDSANKRLEIEKDMGGLRVTLAQITEMKETIMATLQEIKDTLKRKQDRN